MKRFLLSILTFILATTMWAQDTLSINYKQGADQLYQIMRPVVFKMYDSQGPNMGSIISFVNKLSSWMEEYIVDIKKEDKEIYSNVFMNNELILPINSEPGMEEADAQLTIALLRQSCKTKLSENFYALAQNMNTAARKMEYTTVFDTITLDNYAKNDLILVMMLDGIYRTISDISYQVAKDELRGILSAVDKDDIKIGNTHTDNWSEAADELYKLLAPKMVAAYNNNFNITSSDNVKLISGWIEKHSAGMNIDDIDLMSYAQGNYLPFQTTVKNAGKTASQMVKKYKKELKNACSKQCLQTTETMLSNFYSGNYESVFPTIDTTQFTTNDLFWLSTIDATLRAMKKIK